MPRGALCGLHGRNPRSPLGECSLCTITILPELTRKGNYGLPKLICEPGLPQSRKEMT
jgi:hypothetical protein